MNRFRTTFLLFLLVLSSTSFGQNSTVYDQNAEDYLNPVNEQDHPCISRQEYTIIKKQCADYEESRVNAGVRKMNVLASMLSWPIRAAAGFNDPSYYFIAAYVDEDTNTGSIADFNCGSNTYDGHHGTDIAIWPYGFYKMDNNQVEVVAAASGTITAKSDGNFDRNCSSNNLTANYVVIQHPDGTYALYWHMKMNSVTTKAIGQSVNAGEYLGVVGSSGSASGPHLHFEVWSGSTNTTYKDPYTGTCNSLNNATWWTNQKSYTEPAVIKASVNTTDIVLPGCPNTETPNESDVFSIPFQGPGLAPGAAKFYIFLRNESIGLTAECRILNPNGSTFNSWTYTSTANNKTYIKGWTKTLPTIPGTYTFEVTYNNIVCSKTFEIASATAGLSDEAPSPFRIYPNPSDGKFLITVENENMLKRDIRLEICDILGKVVYSSPISAINSEVNLENQKGVYFYSLVSERQIIKTGKLVIQ